MTESQRYLAGFGVGVNDALNGIVEPEHGYPTDPEWQRGMRDGRDSARAAKQRAIVYTPDYGANRVRDAWSAWRDSK